jgi:hypothetical protein
MSAFEGKADISSAVQKNLQLVGFAPLWRISLRERRD